MATGKNVKSKSGKSTSGKNTKKQTQTKKTSSPKSSSSKSSSRSTAKSLEEIRQKNQVRAVLLFASSILLMFLVLVKGENIWQWLHNLLMGLFGGWAIMWPLLMAYVAIVISLEKPHGSITGKIWMTAVVIVLICTTVYIFSDITYPKNLNWFRKMMYLYSYGVESGGAGLVGGLLGLPLIAAFGVIPAKIFITVILVVSIMLLTGTSLINIYKAFSTPVRAVSTGIQNAKVRHEEERRILEENRNEDIDLSSFLPMHPVVSPVETDQNDNGKKNKKAKKSNEKLKALNKAFGIHDDSTDQPYAPTTPIINAPAPAEPVSVQTEPEVNYADSMKINDADTMTVPTSNIDVSDNSAKSFDNTVDAPVNSATDTSSVQSVQSAATVTPVDSSEDALEDAQKAAEEFMKKKEEADKKEVASSAQIALYQESKGKENTYIFPPLTMLAAAKKADVAAETEELQTNGKKLVDTLKSFGIQTKIVDICRGPSVTRYELQPAAGVKISKITNLSDDLALNLAATGIRIEAPIPGKAAVGIEIPNKNKSIVRMRELIESNSFATSKSKLTVALGRDIAGQVTVADLAKMPHILIAGTTGSGKSVCINSLIISLIYKSSPDDVRFLMVDPKVVELGVYNGIPHLLVPVVTDPRKAAGALNWAVTEMLNRYKRFAEFNVKDLQGYNHFAAVNDYIDENGQPIPKMPQIVIIIDELADLMMAAPNEVEDSICRLAQMARAAGMHLVVATQRPTVDVVTGLIKANIPSRIAFAVSSTIDSRTILDCTGAEKLLGQGDMLFSPVGVQKPTRIQGCFVSENEIEAVVDFIKKSRAVDYDNKIIEDIEKNAIENKKDDKQKSESDMDPIMDEAIQCVIEAGQASTSLLQRRLRLGYARAGRLIDEMEQMGIVGPHEGSKPRQVLMTRAQWLERNMQKSDDAAPVDDNERSDL